MKLLIVQLIFLCFKPRDLMLHFLVEVCLPDILTELIRVHKIIAFFRSLIKHLLQFVQHSSLQVNRKLVLI